MDIRRQMDQIYRDMPLERIPWNLAEPPRVLVDAVESGKIKPCKALDIGCGAGNYSVWLASKGFDVTGIDISPQAVKHAESLAAEKGVTCRFVAADLLSEMTEFAEQFDFALDWEVLHHVFPEDRPRFVSNVARILRPGGIGLSMCFSEADPSFGGKGKFRDTPIGTTLYFSSEQELEQLFAPYFSILELGTVETAGKHGPHLAVVAWLRRK